MQARVRDCVHAHIRDQDRMRARLHIYKLSCADVPRRAGREQAETGKQTKKQSGTHGLTRSRSYPNSRASAHAHAPTRSHARANARTHACARTSTHEVSEKSHREFLLPRLYWDLRSSSQLSFPNQNTGAMGRCLGPRASGGLASPPATPRGPEEEDNDERREGKSGKRKSRKGKIEKKKIERIPRKVHTPTRANLEEPTDAFVLFEQNSLIY